MFSRSNGAVSTKKKLSQKRALEEDGKYLRASACKYRKPGASYEIFNFFIVCLNKPFSELFSKIQLKVPKAL